MARFNVGIFGATGAVGKELIKVLADRKFPVGTLRLFASERSEGKSIETPFGAITVENANEVDFTGLDVCLFAIGGGWPTEFAPKAVAAGAYVREHSLSMGYGPQVPLVVPEMHNGAIAKGLLIAST